jgi:hypothetical protein
VRLGGIDTYRNTEMPWEWQMKLNINFRILKTQGAALAWFALLACFTGCDNPPTSPTPPVQTPAPPPAPPPSPPPPPTPSGSLTLSGVVYEHTAQGKQPLAGVPLDISYPGDSFPPRVTTDPEGRYEVRGLAPQNLKVNAKLPGYSQLCRVAIDLGSDSVRDVHLVSDAVLSTTGVPRTMPMVQPILSGVVVERTAEGVRPVTGAEGIAE